eukprot:scaffold2254_cov393-Prasinococcus_capsulatus_cf.AAC.19
MAAGRLKLYLCAYYEATLANLLEVAMFHVEVCEHLPDDALAELVDYCCRRLVYLNASAADDTIYRERTSSDLMHMTEEDEQSEKLAQIRFHSALCAVSIVRYLAEHIASLPIGAMARLLDTNDVIMLLIPLLEARPWMRHRRKKTGAATDQSKEVRTAGVTEVFEEGRWVERNSRDRLQICKSDAQVWLALYHLMVEPKCRARYEWDDSRKAVAMQLRRHFNEVRESIPLGHGQHGLLRPGLLTQILLDQLPILSQLQRLVEELSFQTTPSAPDVKQGRLVLEIMPAVRSKLLNRSDWDTLALSQASTFFADSPQGKTEANERVEEMLKSFEFMMDMETTEKRREQTGQSPAVALEVHVQGLRGWQKIQECLLHVDLDTPTEPVELKPQKDEVEIVRGTRRRLCPPLSIDSDGLMQYDGVANAKSAAGLTLPPEGKLLVKYGDTTAQGIFTLPTCQKDNIQAAAHHPSVMWLTVGLLATDGFAVQVKTMKMHSPAHAPYDSVTSKVYLYRLQGGAITVLGS